MTAYTLITAARNEEAYIEKPLQSVVSQTILPKKWIIVSDGSTDRTDEIVRSYADRFDFIELVSTAGDQLRNFGSKAKAVQYGYDRLADVDYDFIGNLDADVSFEPTYYEKVLAEFNRNQNLGIAGGVRYDLFGEKFIKLPVMTHSVGGPFQFFRKQCYDEIGGYMPLEYGGIDAVAETTARMLGWEVKTFPEITVYHYRPTGVAGGKIYQSRYRAGVRDYLIGYHPLFQIVRVGERMFRRPTSLRRLAGIACWFFGYFFAYVSRRKKPVSKELVDYLRSEQMARLQSILFKRKDLVSKA